MKHELKIQKKFYEMILNHIKTFEIRVNDRGFKSCDWLLLREVNLIKDIWEYTGNEMMIRIRFVEKSEYVKEGYVILYLDMDNYFYYNIK